MLIAMIFRWLTSFSLTVALVAAASLSGSVKLVNSKRKSNRDFSGVVVWLEPVTGEPQVTPGRFLLDQRQKRFLPRVLAIPVGSTVDFPNNDPIFHNAFSNFSGQPFDTGLYAPGTSQKITFRREGFVRVFCNIHSNMSAVIVVVPSSYIAVTTADGAWRMTGLPPGEYRVRIFHERATEPTLRRLETRVVLQEGGHTMDRVEISESGYLEVPHRNKHGRDYPARAQETGPYPGGK